MSVPVSVDFPVAFNAVRKGGRKEDVHIAKVTVAVEFERLDEAEVPVVLRFKDFRWSDFRSDAEGRFFWEMSKVAAGEMTFDSERHDNAAMPRPGNVELADLYPHFAHHQHAAVKSAYKSGNDHRMPKFDAANYKTVDLAAVERQIARRMEVLKRYVVIGDKLHLHVEEPVLRMQSGGRVFLWAADPWHNAYPYSCYSFSELDAAVSMASALDRRFDRQALLERIDIRDPNRLTSTFVERRIALLSNWLLKRLPEFLSALDQIDAGRFIATFALEDQETLNTICDAARKTNRGLIDADVLSVAEQLLNLPDTSPLRRVLDQTVDAHPMIEVLRAEWDNRPVSINLWRRPNAGT